MMPSDQSPPGGDVRRLHPFTLLFASLGLARQLVLPAFVGGMSRADGDAGRLIVWMAAILAIPAVIIAALRYATFRYRLGAEELVIDSGVLRRQHRVIPLVRVQNIDLRESALQRAFGVVELRVETAGSGRGAEATLEVLGRREAEELRAELLARRRAVREARTEGDHGPALAGDPDIAGAAAGIEPADRAVAEREEFPRRARVLARLSVARLAAAGATANEAGLIAAGLAAMLQFIDDLALEHYLPIEALQDRLETTTLAGAIWAIVVLLVAFLLLGWIVSIVGSIVGYHDFTLERVDGELRKQYGLLGRRQTTVPLERVQTVRLEESLLRRPLGLAAIRIETAGGSPHEQRRRGAEAFVPIATVDEVPTLLRGVFADLDIAGLRFEPVHPRSRQRAYVRLVFVGLVLFLLALMFSLLRTGAVPTTMFWWLPVLLVAAWVLAAWQYRHRGYALLPGYVLARAGVLNRVTWIVPDRKIQTLHRVATPFQRRQGLATIILDTAGGGRQGRILDLGDDAAASLLEEGAHRAARGSRAADPAGGFATAG